MSRLQFRGGTAPLSKARSKQPSPLQSGPSSPTQSVLGAYFRQSRPITAAGECSQISDINLALKFNRQMSLLEGDDFLAACSDTDDVHACYDDDEFLSRPSSPNESRNGRSEELNGSTLQRSTLSSAMRDDARTSTKKRESAPTRRITEPHRSMAANIMSQIRSYSSAESKAPFSTSTSTRTNPQRKPSSLYNVAPRSLDQSPYMMRSSSAKDPRIPPKLRKTQSVEVPRAMTFSAPTQTKRADNKVTSAASGKEPVLTRENSGRATKLNSSAATLMATTKTKHPNLLFRQSSAEMDARLDPASSLPPPPSTPPPVSSDASNSSTLLDEDARSYAEGACRIASAEDEQLARRIASRAQSRRVSGQSQPGSLLVSSSMSVLATEKSRPKSRKLYLGIDDEASYTSNPDDKLRKSASSYSVNATQLKRPPSRQKVAAQNLFDSHIPEDLTSLAAHSEILIPSHPRAKSATAVVSKSLLYSEVPPRHILTALPPGCGGDDPNSDGFTLLDESDLMASPFRTIVTNYDQGVEKRRCVYTSLHFTSHISLIYMLLCMPTP